MCCIMGYAGHDLPKETFTEYLLRTTSRGPDDQRVAETEFGLLGFGRLAIMGLTPEGMQPFFRGADCVACNGELYGFRPVKAELEAEGYTFESDSDCEIILPLYYKYGLDMFRHLDAEFAMILYDSRKKLLIAARDPIGIRPLFYGYSESGHIAFASEAKNLVGLCKKIYPFPIGSYYCNGQFVRYCDIADTPAYSQDALPEILTNIREKLVAGVDKRLDADTPVGYEVGMKCPDFTVSLYGEEGGEFTLSAQKGKVTVINFWATWCTPCVAELPYFAELYAEYGDEISLVAIHSNLVTDDVDKFLAKENLNMPFALDKTGAVIKSLGGSTQLPMTVIVDAAGKIVYNKGGSVTLTVLEGLVAPLLAE